jgi:hypothetical protein
MLLKSNQLSRVNHRFKEQTQALTNMRKSEYDIMVYTFQNSKDSEIQRSKRRKHST